LEKRVQQTRFAVTLSGMSKKERGLRGCRKR
jgi:hypothetical protein